MTDAEYSALIARLKPCPFCGGKIHNDPDALYPTWSPRHVRELRRNGWKQREVVDDRWTMTVFCNEVWGGCGAQAHGHGIGPAPATEAAIAAWNRRAEPQR